MPAPKHFGVVMAQAITDPRVIRAAKMYEERRLAKPHFAHAAVLGHLAMIGLWCHRDNDDGFLPGDGVVAVCAALVVGTDLAKTIIGILSHPEVDLLTTSPEGASQTPTDPSSTPCQTLVDPSSPPRRRIRGFRDAYAPLLKKRDGNRDRQARRRENVGPVTRDVTRDVTPLSRVMSHPRVEKSREDNHSVGSRVARPQERNRSGSDDLRTRLERALTFAVNAGPPAEGERAKTIRDRLRKGDVSDAEASTLLAGEFLLAEHDSLLQNPEPTTSPVGKQVIEDAIRLLANDKSQVGFAAGRTQNATETPLPPTIG